MPTHNHELSSMARNFFSHLTDSSGAVTRKLPPAGPQDEITFASLAASPPVPPAAIDSDARCKVKGCVYPATEIKAGLCLRHFHQDTEPQFFHSRQPSLRLLEAAVYGIATEDEERRIRLLRHRAALRRSFLKGVS